MRTRDWIWWWVVAGCSQAPAKPTTSETGTTPSDSADSGAEDTDCAQHLASLGGVEVAPTRTFPACEDPTGRTYEDVAEAWGLVPPAAPLEEHNRGGVVAVEDFNQDGVLDVIFGYASAPLVAFWGTGTGFTATLLDGTDGANPVVAVDLDNDDDLDLLSLGPPVQFLRNDGGAFSPYTLLMGAGAPPVDLSPADFNADGRLDLYVAAAGPHSDDPSLRADRLLLADGSGGFTLVELALPDAGGLGFDSMAADLDSDGDIDVYAVNDFGTTVGPNVLWDNQDGTLVSQNDDCACDLAISGMGVDAADMDGDGLSELLIASTGLNHLLQQTGDGVYVDVAQAIGADPLSGLPTMAWGQIFFDYDDDGKLDIVVAEGDLWLSSTDPDLRAAYDGPVHLMVNVGTRAEPVFEDHADAVGLGGLGSWRSVVPADFNNDGMVDLLITDVVGPPRLMLARGCTGNGAFEVDAPLHTRVEACIGGERHVASVKVESGWGGSRPHHVRLGTGTHPIPETVVLIPPAGASL